MTFESLEDAIARVGNPVDLLRNSPVRPHTFPLPPEYTNWRTEQRSWRETVCLLDQSHHMTDLFVSGPDTIRLLSDLGVNTFANFAVDKAKQLVVTNKDGYLIGDCILFHLAEDSVDLVGLPMAMDWVQFNAETGGYDVTIERDDNSAVRKGDPKYYRYELQGPNSIGMVEKLTGQPAPELKFFTMGRITIAGHEVRTLRHGIVGQPGFEMFGPWAEGEDVLNAILEIGDEFGMQRAGAKAYSSTNLESGWIPAPLPAIFGPEMEEYRRWLPAAKAGSLGGSLLSDDITDYYATPYDFGYGRSVNFDHDFVGKEALQKLSENPPRKKVTLVWNADDVAAAMSSVFREGAEPAKAIEMPKARYALYQQDEVLHDGEHVGVSYDNGNIINENVFVSLASVDAAVAEPGTEVVVVWGEDPITAKPQVERHVQVTIRATVAPAPYEQFARENYRAQ
jgi:vanillate/3-O-methylgallate O-demethylase